MVRRAHPHEAEIVAGLLVEFRDHMGSDWPSENAFIAGVERLIETRDCEYWLGGAGPDAVAQVRFRWSVWKAAEDCWLEDLYVRESGRGRGLGRAMVEAVLERARERGCRRVELDVEEDNAPARAVYERLGFKTGKTGERTLFMTCRL